MQGYFYSIIIPVRHCSSYLSEGALPSLSSQTYSNFEVIIMTEYPDEFTKETSQYPWLIVQQSQGAPGKKRDEGAHISKGEILAFVDDDVMIPPTWLERINELFLKKPDQKALGGPGILPERVNIWERIFDQILISFLGSGGYRYRFICDKERYIDDYPSMDFIIEKKLFLEVGGFNNNYWPGEDSKLGELLKSKNVMIFYNPSIYIYHHRRNDLKGFLLQHMRYGSMRGAFFAQGDSNSRRISYLIPLFFVLYLIFIMVMMLNDFFGFEVYKILTLPLIAYILLLMSTTLQALWHTRNVLIAIGTMIVLPITHIVYGFSFMKGFMNVKK